jgi:hypothetical protein
LLKATALVLAIVLWLIATAKEPATDFVPVRFNPALDSSVALLDPPPPIRALVAGRGEDLLKLYQTPLVITRAIANDVADTLAIDLSPADVRLPAGLENAIIVRDVQPRVLTLHFETSSTRHVPVRSQVRGEPAGVPFSVRFEPESVEVSGPRRAVQRVTHVQTMRASIPVGDSIPHLVDLDTAKLGARVKPAQVKVYVTPQVAPAGIAGSAGASTARQASSARP